MVLRHGNRIRKQGGRQAVSEARVSESAPVPSPEPTEAEIRQRAHEIYRDRGDAPGDSVRDWLQAETELRARAGLPEARCD